MIDYINENKEWIFSGIGISVFTIIYLIVRRFIHRSKQYYSQSEGGEIAQKINPRTLNQEKDSNRGSFHPTPKEIFDEIRKAPPFQQKEKEKNYIGLRIKWDVTLSFISSSRNDEIDLYCYFKGFTRGVEVKTNLKKYPEIKIAKEGQKITVEGVIQGFDGGSMAPIVDAHSLTFK